MSAFRFPTATGLLKILVGFTLSLAISVTSAMGQDEPHQTSAGADKSQSASGAATGPRMESPTSPLCEIEGAKTIRINCHYSASPVTDLGNREPRVVLNHAVLVFKTRDDNYMHVDLTFTNEGKDAISDEHPVYLAIDDETGNNYVRRLLPHVDFRNLPPGGQQTFSERLLTPAFQPRRYIIWLWIPNPDPASKFDSARNFLLSSAGVPDSKSGLNLIAKFSATR